MQSVLLLVSYFTTLNRMLNAHREYIKVQVLEVPQGLQDVCHVQVRQIIFSKKLPILFSLLYFSTFFGCSCFQLPFISSEQFAEQGE